MTSVTPNSSACGSIKLFELFCYLSLYIGPERSRNQLFSLAAVLYVAAPDWKAAGPGKARRRRARGGVRLDSLLTSTASVRASRSTRTANGSSATTGCRGLRRRKSHMAMWAAGSPSGWQFYQSWKYTRGYRTQVEETAGVCKNTLTLPTPFVESTVPQKLDRRYTGSGARPTRGRSQRQQSEVRPHDAGCRHFRKNVLLFPPLSARAVCRLQ